MLRQNRHMDQLEVSNPSHHLTVIWISFDSRCKPKPGEGTTDSQEEAQGEATDRTALLAGEEDFDKIWKCWAWIIPDKQDLLENGRVQSRTDRYRK